MGAISPVLLPTTPHLRLQAGLCALYLRALSDSQSILSDGCGLGALDRFCDNGIEMLIVFEELLSPE
ncbi:MAG: hypothetical protein J7M27_03215 [Candidatus Latescibacteria bacterium]|nr:hypothetical protein [Candidatus Latescibacterota bacterium]